MPDSVHYKHRIHAGCQHSTGTQTISGWASHSASLALELSVREFWPAVPGSWSEFCLYRELHEDFRMRADQQGPHVLFLDGRESESWELQQHDDDEGGKTVFLLLSHYRAAPFSQPVFATVALKRLKRLRVVGCSPKNMMQIRSVLPALARTLTHLEVDAAEDGIAVYREILANYSFAGMHDGCLHWIIMQAFETEAALWLRCLPGKGDVEQSSQRTKTPNDTAGRSEGGLDLVTKLTIARKLVMAKMFPCESDTDEGAHPLMAAAAQGITSLQLLLSIGFENQREVVQRLFQAMCDEPRSSTALHVLCSAGASPHDPAAFRNALDRHCRDALHFLLARSVDVNMRLGDVDAPKTTALHFAAYNADAELMGLLLDAGGDPRLVDEMGQLPEDYCRHEFEEGVDDAAMIATLREAARELARNEALALRRRRSETEESS